MAQILVVDDEPDVRELFNITLKMAGHQTETARDGLEAVDKLNGSSPDLILLDLMMPRMDGFAFLSHIRETVDNTSMRVLIATAKTLEEIDRQMLSTWPVVGVLNKGDMDVAQMVGVVSSALTKNAARPSGGVPSASPKPASSEPAKKPKAAANGAKPSAPSTSPVEKPSAPEKNTPRQKPEPPSNMSSTAQTDTSKRAGGWLSGLIKMG